MDVAEQLINAHGIVKNITREDRANVSRPLFSFIKWMYCQLTYCAGVNTTEMREEAVAKKKAKKTEDTTGTDKTPSSSTNQAPQASPQGDDNLASTQRATADKT